uniref:Uncharacterized protein n=1 Tax=Rhizophora mucronata TaxID=61149 RepID=A0A2P2P8E2_RHIMU
MNMFIEKFFNGLTHCVINIGVIMFIKWCIEFDLSTQPEKSEKKFSVRMMICL